MKVHETRSHAHSSLEEEGKVGTRKQKSENKGHDGELPASKSKKAKATNKESDDAIGKSPADVAAEFEEFCKATREHLSIDVMRLILEANDEDSSGSDDVVVPRCQDMLFYGALVRCPVCGAQIDCTGSNYACTGPYSEWTHCTYTTRESPRSGQPLKVPEGIQDTMVLDWVKDHESMPFPHRALTPLDKPLAGMIISLFGRLSRTHHYWIEVIEMHGGKVSNTVPGVTCLVVSPAEHERGGSVKVVEAMERNIPVVREAWLIDSIQKQAAQPLDAYDAPSNLAPEGKGIPWDRQDPNEEALESLAAEDDGYDVRYGGLGRRQLGIAVAHCKLDPLVANLMKVLCFREIYKYALMEMGLDSPDLPMGMLSDFHLKRCEELLLKFREYLRTMPESFTSSDKANMLWLDFSNKWFTLMHSTRPFTIRDFQELADHIAAALETVRDITVASHLIGDMTGATIDDPLFDRYKKLGCSIRPLDKESEDYKMILKYLEKTYEPVKVGNVSYGVSVENIFAVESSAGPSYDDVKKLPNKVLLWCGTRSSSLLRHLHKGFLPAICSIPVPGYMFGRAIVCSDAAAEAARYGFTAVNRPEGFLVLAVASLGDQITEISTVPEDTKPTEEKKMGVKGLGRKKTDESEHFTWKDDVKVPCGRLVPSECKDSPLEYNEYAVYDPKQVSIRYLVRVKYEEKRMKIQKSE